MRLTVVIVFDLYWVLHIAMPHSIVACRSSTSDSNLSFQELVVTNALSAVWSEAYGFAAVYGERLL